MEGMKFAPEKNLSNQFINVLSGTHTFPHEIATQCGFTVKPYNHQQTTEFRLLCCSAIVPLSAEELLGSMIAQKAIE